MTTYQYRVVPAPTKGLKAKGIKGPEARFSNAIEDLMNTMGAEGWEYQRAETLPSQERVGLTGSATQWRNVLVFRKPRGTDVSDFSPELLPAPFPIESEDDMIAEENNVAEVETEVAQVEDVAQSEAAQEDEHPAGGAGATQMLADNGVEETSEVAGMTDSLKTLAVRRSPESSEG
jgi:hypothetical protein